MVRSAAERAFLPTRNMLEEIGDIVLLTGRTISSALRPPYPYGGEFVSQFLFVLRLCWLPLMISAVCINYAAPGLQGANFLTLSARWTGSAACSCSRRSARSAPT